MKLVPGKSLCRKWPNIGILAAIVLFFCLNDPIAAQVILPPDALLDLDDESIYIDLADDFTESDGLVVDFGQVAPGERAVALLRWTHRLPIDREFIFPPTDGPFYDVFEDESSERFSREFDAQLISGEAVIPLGETWLCLVRFTPTFDGEKQATLIINIRGFDLRINLVGGGVSGLVEDTKASGIRFEGEITGAGEEVVIFRIGLRNNDPLRVGTVHGVHLTISDVSPPTGLTTADFSEILVYQSTESTFNTFATRIYSRDIYSIVGISPLDIVHIVQPLSFFIPFGILRIGSPLDPGSEAYFFVTARIGLAATRGHRFKVSFEDGDVEASPNSEGIGTGFTGGDNSSVFISPQVHIARKTVAKDNVGPGEQVDIEIQASFMEGLHTIAIELEVPVAHFDTSATFLYTPPRAFTPKNASKGDVEVNGNRVRVSTTTPIDPPLFLNSSLGKITLTTSASFSATTAAIVKVTQVVLNEAIMWEHHFDFFPLVIFINGAARTLGSRTNYGAGGQPSSVYAADLDGDGDNDLVTANSSSGTVSVLLNDGAGQFSAQVEYAAGDGAISVFAADLDGDGDKDLAVANQNAGSVSVLLSNGDGTFAPETDYGAGAQSSSVFAADLDGDGDNDLVVANSGSNDVSVLLNNGNGDFPTRMDYVAGNHPVSVFSADLDGDGDEDLAIANQFDNNVSVMLNNGDGTLKSGGNYGAGSAPLSLFAADLDGDGDNDLVVANSGSNDVSVLLNNGDGTFAPGEDYAAGDGAGYVFSADLDGDGDNDLVVANSGSNDVSVLSNNGDGTFAPGEDYAAGDGAGSVISADLDGDGDNDLAVANRSSGTVSVLLNQSDVAVNRHAVLGDVNEDGRVNSRDALQALLIGLGSRQATETQHQAADADCDGQVNSRDALRIFQHTLSGEELVCPSAKEVVARRSEEPVPLLGLMHSRGREEVLELNLDGEEVYGVELVVEYDPEKMQWLELQAAEDGRLAGAHEGVPGRVSVAVVAGEALGEAAQLGALVFRRLGEGVEELPRVSGEAFGRSGVGRRLEPVIQREGGQPRPLAYRLKGSYPNPFNPETTIRYELPEPALIHLAVYDLLGQRVRVLVAGARGAGEHVVVWGGKDEADRVVSSGVYLYRLKSETGFSAVKKMTLLR